MRDDRVICLGEAIIDRIFQKSSKSQFDSYNDFLGGAPANVACALSKLGIPTSFIGRIGDENYLNQFTDTFSNLKIDYSGLQVDKSFPTRIIKVERSNSGERRFIGFVGDNKIFPDQEINKDQIIDVWESLSENVSVLVLGTILLASNKSLDSVSWVIERSKELNIKVVFDINWRSVFWESNYIIEDRPSNKAIKLIKEFLQYGDLLKLAREEAIWFFSTDNPELISRSFANSPDVVITDGAFNIKWFINGILGNSSVYSSPEIIDTTGAGDNFLAGLIYGYMQKEAMDTKYKIQNIIKFAAACGFLVCLGTGAIEPQPTINQVKSFLISEGL
tara:strand:+ start:14293 stop:15291 length:999 start_codon:yes stop_codon:yes gene_type:complete